MPTTIMTDVFTLEELEALGNKRAVERALDWMAEVWADVAVEQTTDTIDETLDALCGSGTSLHGRRTGPITWYEWDYHRMFLTLDVWLRPESLRPVEGEFGGDHPLAGLPNLPHADLVELVEVNGRSRDITVHSKDADLTEQQQQDIADWLTDLEHRLTKLMLSEYEYLTSREYLMECALANEYTFTADGKRFG